MKPCRRFGALGLARRFYHWPLFWITAALWVNAALAANLAPAPKKPAEHLPPRVLERVVMLVRHGIRAPLDHEAAAADLADGRWPLWDVAASQLTAHGRKTVTLSGQYFRQWLIHQGLIPAKGCPAAGGLRINTNTDQRTIDSGQLLGAAILPSCQVAIEHQPLGTNDPLYRPVESGVVAFDAEQAIADIQRSTGGINHLVTAHRPEFATLQTVLGCQQHCPFASMPSHLAPSSDGRSLRLEGPIHLASGTAEVLLLEYVQGLPKQAVGWGRVTPQRLAQLSQLHSLLFDIYARSPYMSSHSAARLTRELLANFTAAETSHPAKVTVFVGSDTHIAALSAVLGVHFHLPGYGRDDPSPSSALLIELWRQTASNERFVRFRYVGQSPEQLRHATPLSLHRPPQQQTLHSSLCPSSQVAGFCPLSTLSTALQHVLTIAGANGGQTPVVSSTPPPRR